MEINNKYKEVSQESIKGIEFTIGGVGYALLTRFGREELKKYNKSIEVFKDLFNIDSLYINNYALYVDVRELQGLKAFWSIYNGIDEAIGLVQ